MTTLPVTVAVLSATGRPKTEIGNKTIAKIVTIIHAATITLSLKIVFANFGFNIITHLLLN